jgi:putative transposon-encoded protein
VAFERKSKENSKSRSGVGQGAEPKAKVKFEIYGKKMIEKKVSPSGNSGRIYLPPDWVDHFVKIIRVD